MIWAVLFLTSLTPNIVLAFGDIFSDAYLVSEYHSNMVNASYMEQHEQECERLTVERPYPLQAYASCLDARSQARVEERENRQKPWRAGLNL